MRTADEWLGEVGFLCATLAHMISKDQKFSFAALRVLFEQDKQITDATWEVTNMLASVVNTDPAVIEERIPLRNAAVERLTQIVDYIKKELQLAA